MSETVKTVESCTIKVTPEQEKWVCLCYLCYPDGKEYFELIPDCWLFQNNEGQWGLMCQPGHKDDHAILMFPEKPWPDPDRECESEDEAICALNDKWIDLVCNMDEKVLLRPQDGHFLVESCKAAGYDKQPRDESAHRLLLHWLFDFAGRKLAEYESQRDSGVQPPSEQPAPQAEGGVVDGGGSGSEVDAERPGERGGVQGLGSGPEPA